MSSNTREIKSLYNVSNYCRSCPNLDTLFVKCHGCKQSNLLQIEKVQTEDNWKPYCDCTQFTLKHPCVIDCKTIGCKGWKYQFDTKSFNKC